MTQKTYHCQQPEKMATFWDQFKILMWKNILLKKRNKKQVAQEILYPLYFIAILILVKAFNKGTEKPRITDFPTYSMTNAKFLDRNFFNGKYILISPDTSNSHSMANETIKVFKEMGNITSGQGPSLMYFTDKTAMDDYYDAYTDNVAAGIIFEYSGGDNYSYALRFPSNKVPGTGSWTSVAGQCRDGDGLDQSSCDVNQYLNPGFSLLQLAIDTVLIRMDYPSYPLPDVTVEMLPKPSYKPDSTYIQVLSSIYFVLAYSPFVNFLTVHLVAEKEKKIKEGMKMMGLRDSAFWLSWGLVYLIFISIVTVVTVILAYVSGFFINSNVFLFFLILMFYGLSIISFACLLTPFFNKAQTAGGVASLFVMLLSCLYLVVSLTRQLNEDGTVTYSIPAVARGFMCLISPCCVSLAIDQAVFLDIGVGMDFTTAGQGDFPLYIPMFMLLFDSILYFVLAMYLDNVIPTEYGAKKPPYYIFMKSYWCPGTREEDNDERAEDYDALFGNDVEKVTSDMREHTGVRILNLTKEFSGKEETVTAVYKLSLEMYTGQITCLLGHNGAGKTTLFNMLSGLVSPTRGTAKVLGLDINNPGDMLKIRQTTGVCPQHNILFDKLTVIEHLKLFAGIKGTKKDNMMKSIKQILNDVGLLDQDDTFALNLSGGQKRKLSVAIALIGDPKIVFLDEPTAGIDPFSRRHLWSVLKEKKKGRVILLTTHFMDEADILADRKAFISKGQLRCCGSSLFLKNRFGIGYHLNMVVDKVSDRDSITDLVCKNVDGAKHRRTHGKELAYTLPLEEVGSFKNLFAALESKSTEVSTLAESMGIKSYGVSMTTLEEVFLALEEDDQSMDIKDVLKLGGHAASAVTLDNNHDAEPISKSTANILEALEKSPLVKEQDNLKTQQFWALSKVRLIRSLKDKALLFVNLILPVVFVVVGLVVSKTSAMNTATAPSPLNLTLASGIYANYTNYSPSAKNPPVLLRDSLDSAGYCSVGNYWNNRYLKFGKRIAAWQSMSWNDEKISCFVGTTTGNAFLQMFRSMFETKTFTNSSEIVDTTSNFGIDLKNLTVTASSISNVGYSILYNSKATHSIPSVILLMSNSLLSMASSLVNGTRNTISAASLPLWKPSTKLTYNNNAFSSVILVAIAFVVVPPGFAVDLVKDRQYKIRSQLRTAGVPFSVYWLSNFFIDVCKFCIPAVFCIILTAAIQVDSLKPGGAMVSLVLLFLTIIPSSTLFVYIFQFLFDNFETCQSSLTVLYFFISFLPYLAVSLVDMISGEIPARIMHYIFVMLLPPYKVFGGIYYIDRIYRTSLLGNGQDITFGEYFKWESNILFPILWPLVEIPLYIMLLRIIDVRKTGGEIQDALPCISKKNSNEVDTENSDIIEDEDEDVAEERQRVKALQTRERNQYPVVMVENLRKEFAKRGKQKRKGCKKVQGEEKVKVVVRNTSFAVESGEVLGLLGPNGAGKTTTLNMVIAEVGPTKGKVHVGGHDVRSSMSEAFKVLGYCPQHDALWDLVQLDDHLRAYAAIRGIPKKDIENVINYYIKELKLEDHAGKMAKKLSGGTKRKLSYIISMLGQPKVVLMDEPSTGMDPQSKRFLWDTISSSFSGTERGAILTTHYMEEADALCTRVAIMVNGKLECIGATQHLKNKYSSGYLLEVKLKIEDITDEEQAHRLEELQNYVVSLFPNAVTLEKFGTYAQFKVPKEDVPSLANVFASLEEGKRHHGMEEYSFSQSTLEQVFIEFAKRQLDEHAGDHDDDDQIDKIRASSLVI
ncbi:cholesterol transporter ABCA5-like isoform X3 [Mytilus galloprovincialis]|uniref:cholesterol transporter ABCA5-like isoform X3 n=1 Tax=Mytilus galloprovincialis TaxID=29158 RepID=UPI003F7CD22A